MMETGNWNLVDDILTNGKAVSGWQETHLGHDAVDLALDALRQRHIRHLPLLLLCWHGDMEDVVICGQG